MTALVVQGDAARLPLPDRSVDLIVTSPPYFALRSYTDAGSHYEAQIGSEPTPAAYLDALWACTREWMRVLKPEGSLWVNLGDKYAGSGGGGGTGSSDGFTGRGSRPPRFNVGIPAKSLMGIPWRYAIGCIDQLGLILRAEVIWSKPNGLPESVTDRVRRSHEQWFHMVKQPRYYSAVDEIREPHVATITGRDSSKWRPGPSGNREVGRGRFVDGAPNEFALSSLGKLPGSVWSVPSEPLQVPPGLGVDHFAAFPTEWPRRLILGWSPPGICTACGQGRRPVATRLANGRERKTTTARDPSWIAINRADWTEEVKRTITGYACSCTQPDAPTRPSVICDPFGGTGTTALVAHALGRTGISVDMSGDYSRLARWRTTARGELARALRVDKPAKPIDGQLDMFEVGA